ncbi:putative receptor-like protein 8 [Quercus lobata]|uniref:putative receptor-like protein 8 n=1 Tax=Quercus lobata TaxID=97700 RepID=UPI001247DA64|nr:putative receptor-like protein 8 [Quercus lobata]
MHIDLSWNLLQKDILRFLGALPDLKYLDLSYNEMQGPLSSKELSNLRNLEVLIVRENRLNGSLPFKDMTNFRSLEILDMSGNMFIGIFSPYIGTLSSLKTISLSQNKLHGNLYARANLTSLEYIDLSYNRFGGLFSFSSFANHSKLKVIRFKGENYQIEDGNKIWVCLLSGNNFSGVIPDKLCWLKNIAIMDLSKNNFSGTIPHCFHDLKFEEIDAFNGLTEPNSTFLEFRDIIVPYQSILKRNFENFEVEREVAAEIGIEFVMKYKSYFYKGGILDLMSGLDLSVNKLTGGIPLELGQLSPILALNLSYNQLTGSIPNTFSKLTQLESLDLSHNNLSGEIPSSLIDLHFLAVFNVAYNNLSSKVPNMKGQVGTFQNSSYEGNPFLCGPPLEKGCTRVDKTPPSPKKSSNASHRKCGGNEARPSPSTQHNMYGSTQVGPSTSACNEPTTFNKYNPINVNEYCMSLYQQIGSSTSLGQGFEGLYSYDHYPQPSSRPPSYHPLPPPSYSGQYNYDQDSQSPSPQHLYPTLYHGQPMSNPFHNNPYPHGQYSHDQHDLFITPQPSQPFPHVGDFYKPPNTWACSPNSKEEASITDYEEDASIQDNGEDAKDVEDMKVSSKDESDEGGNYQTF